MELDQQTYEDLYDEYADIYDLQYSSLDAEYTKLIDVIEKLQISAEKFSSVLDLGCGTGQSTAAFAKLGFEVTGVDISAESLNRANERLRRLSLSATLIKNSILDLNLDNKFDVIFASSGLINHFTSSEAQTQFLKKASELLNPNGILAICCDQFDNDILNKQTRISVPNEVYQKGLNGASFQIRSPKDKKIPESYVCSTYTLLDDNSVYVMKVPLYFIKPITLSAMLKQRFGFDKIRWFSPWESGYHQHVCIAEKQPKSVSYNKFEKDVSLTASNESIEILNIIWDVSKSTSKILDCLIQPNMLRVNLHYVQLLGDEENPSDMLAKKEFINSRIQDYEKRTSHLSISNSFATTVNDELMPLALTMSYMAAQFAMTYELTKNDIVYIIQSEKHKYDKEIEHRCLNVIKSIMRSEEIPVIKFLPDA